MPSFRAFSSIAPNGSQISSNRRPIVDIDRGSIIPTFAHRRGLSWTPVVNLFAPGLSSHRNQERRRMLTPFGAAVRRGCAYAAPIPFVALAYQRSDSRRCETARRTTAVSSRTRYGTRYRVLDTSSRVPGSTPRAAEPRLLRQLRATATRAPSTTRCARTASSAATKEASSFEVAQCSAQASNAHSLSTSSPGQRHPCR